MVIAYKDGCDTANQSDQVWDQKWASKVSTDSFVWCLNLLFEIHSITIDEEGDEPKRIDK